jgi:hypothetical protein
MGTTYSIARAATAPTLSGSGSTRTFTLTPIAVGNFILFSVAWQVSTLTLAGLSCPSLSLFFFASGTPTVANIGGSNYAFQQYVGIPSSTTPSTFTIQLSGTPSFINIDYIEISADSITRQNGSWEWDSQEKIGTSSTTVLWSSPTIFSDDDMFLGWGFPANTPTVTNGTPAGFNYVRMSDINVYATNLAYGSAVTVAQCTQSAGTYYTQSGRLVWIPETIPNNINYGSY